ncbi:DUF4350 domain-containing protein [Nocardioides sp. TF02-7]|uniref:DUF4350 domain-containing protein n=1 Tax=Nocardioides sp. TF02-7 TaxID=2917724 RepID=UPI001F067F83|nr:DUF4350 domain-containing protein [Nocardioides sp. TF02-7]UMG93440.1 DUF4350 domain-containing protein [Nocardioides sp. TF02-7]
MTTPTAAPAAPTATAEPAAPGFWRRHRVWVLAAVALVLAVVVAVWIGGDDERHDGRYDPQNPGPEGARALAQVLEDEGVDVSVVRSADALAATDAGRGTTVVVTSAEQLARSTLERLVRDTRGARVVLVEPPYHLLGELEAGLDTAYSDGEEVRGDCADQRFDDLAITVDRATAYTTGSGCFPGEDEGYLLASGRDGLSLLGAGEALTNDQVLRGDNAAVALRLLGDEPELVWYVATIDDAVGEEAVSIWSFAPDWLVPAVWTVLLACVALLGWRFRRLGPLTTEPLPVVVRAVETTLSRGRMYRRSDDRAHAAAALRAATRRRLAARLALGRPATEADVVTAVAHHLGRREDEVAVLISSTAPEPTTDHDLVRLGEELDRLDREVRRG